MPELSGIELVKIIKPLRPNLPVLLLTGNHCYKKDCVRAHGAFDILYKPYSADDLTRSVPIALMTNSVQMTP